MSITTDSPIGVPDWTLTDRLRKAREHRGLTQQELAAASDGEISLRTISNYENPRYDKERKRAILRSWAFVTGVPLDWLLHGITAPDGPGGQEERSTIWYLDDFRRESTFERAAVA